MDENLRTFLQHHSNMKYSLFLKKLKQSIYTPIAQLNAFVHKSTEPLCFEDMKNERFDNIKIGDSWGGFFDCAWFKFTADIENMQKNLVAVIDVGGEGCIYNKDGEVIQGITNVLGMVDNFQTVKGKAVIPLDRIDTFKDGKVLFYADCGNNGRGGKSSGQARFKRADICVFRQDILDLYYDILACYQLLSAVNDNAQKREIKAHINKAISLAHNTDSQSVLNARNALSKMFDGKYKQNFTVYAVGHGHLDLAWLWPVRETKRKAIRTFSNAVYESEQCPSYVFNGSQPQQYEFIKEISPEFFERIKQSVQRGNIEPQGGMWAESDTNLPCGESLIRQCFYGKKYFREEFQKDVKTLWLPDVFGYTAALPQIIKKCGMDTFMTIKLSWNNINDFPHHTFIWNGLDDSKVLVHMPPEGDYNSNATPYAFEKTYQKYKEKQVSDIALMSFGIGDGGGGPGEYHINMVKRCENLRYIPNVKMSSSESFFDKLKKDVSNYPEYNYIHDVVLQSSDAGAIYTGYSYSTYGNVVRYNCISNIGSGTFTPSGIYFDDNSSGQTAYGNVLINIPGYAFLVGGGRDNMIENNLVINAGKQILYDDRAYDGYHNDGWYAKNCKTPDSRLWQLMNEAKEFNASIGNKYDGIERMHQDYEREEDEGFAVNPSGSSVQNNIIISKQNKVGEIAKTVKKYSVVENNQTFTLNGAKSSFEDYENGDYRIKADSKISKECSDFKEIPFNEIGRK